MEEKQQITNVLKPKSSSDINIEDIISYINNNKDSGFSTFLMLELKKRFENRPTEETYIKTFEQWIKILNMREENRIQQGIKDFIEERKKNKEVKKNKEYFKNKDIDIPEYLKNMSTKDLLMMRFSYWYNDTPYYNEEQVYAELANRPHIPNKQERKEIARKKSKHKGNRKQKNR